MKPDIQSKLKKELQGDEFLRAIGEIAAWDAETKGLLDDHLIRAVVQLSAGDLTRFHALREQARTQRAEVIRAEVHENSVRRRDLSRQFGNENV